jgi:hypothetical protein
MDRTDDKLAERPGESDPKAKKTFAKKGALPPDKLAITIDEAETSKDTYVFERPTLVDNNVLTSTSDVGEYDPQPGGITSTPTTQDVS